MRRESLGRTPRGLIHFSPLESDVAMIERPREARDGRFAEHVTEHRHLQQQSVDGDAPLDRQYDNGPAFAGPSSSSTRMPRTACGAAALG
jgi:hypothetical protein